MRMARSLLWRLVAEMPRPAVALSGGVDSSLVAKVVYDVHGAKALALTAVSPSLSRHALQRAVVVAQAIGIRHVLVPTRELTIPGYRRNGQDRCFFCRMAVYRSLWAEATRRGALVLLDGQQADDDQAERPGMEATARLSVLSPLRQAGLTKREVRALARALSLPTADDPPDACLSSRIPFGRPIREAWLRQVEAAEAVLRSLGVRLVRVRHHGDLARIEVEREELMRVVEFGPMLAAELQKIGFRYVTLDVLGYRGGGGYGRPGSRSAAGSMDP